MNRKLTLQTQIYDSVMRVIAKHVKMQDAYDMNTLYLDIEAEAMQITAFILKQIKG